LNNIVEQDHRFIKWRIKQGLGFKEFESARRTIAGIVIVHMSWEKSIDKSRARYVQIILFSSCLESEYSGIFVLMFNRCDRTHILCFNLFFSKSPFFSI